jgi:hypothetical protein
MSAEHVDRDERTVVVEDASYRWAYLFMTYGGLIIVMYRGLALHQTAWDVFALVLLGGAIHAAYQWSHRVLTRRWSIKTAAVVVLAAALAAAWVWLLS